MLNKSLEIYKELYSKYVEARVHLHNYHCIFVKRCGYGSQLSLKKYLRSLSELESELKKASLAAYREQVAINKQTKKEYKKQKYRNTSGLGKKRKNVDVPK
jgi:hypothetical protein